ncbi:MAG: hypothetical protein AAF231_13540 [Pseudomonadota bacterium]
MATFPDKAPEINGEVAAALAWAGRMEETHTKAVRKDPARGLHLLSILRLYTYKPERERRLKGYRKAGFV